MKNHWISQLGSTTIVAKKCEGCFNLLLIAKFGYIVLWMITSSATSKKWKNKMKTWWSVPKGSIFGVHVHVLLCVTFIVSKVLDTQENSRHPSLERFRITTQLSQIINYHVSNPHSTNIFGGGTKKKTDFYVLFFNFVM